MAEHLTDAFFELPRVVYGDDLLWRAEPPALTRALFDQCQEGQVWVKVVPQKLRLVGMCDPRVELEGKPVCYFGYWETIADYDLNREAFGELLEWARAQGVRTLLGPINFNTYHQYRLNLTPEHQQQFFLAPYHPPYYPSLLAEMGFQPFVEYANYLIEGWDQVEHWYQQYSQTSSLEELDYQFERITVEGWEFYLPQIYQKSHLLFSENFAYSPIDFDTFCAKYGKDFIAKACLWTSTLVLTPEGRLVGIGLNFPDYTPLLRENKATLSAINFAQHFPLLKDPYLLVKTAGILPEHRHMGMLFIKLLLQMIPLAEQRYHKLALCLMREGNFASLLGRDLAQSVQRYALYKRTCP